MADMVIPLSRSPSFRHAGKQPTAEDARSATSTSDLAPLTTNHNVSVMGDDVNIVVRHHAIFFVHQGFHGCARPVARHHSSRCHGFHGWHLLFLSGACNGLDLLLLLYSLFKKPMRENAAKGVFLEHHTGKKNGQAIL
jgi:hypothetical protein